MAGHTKKRNISAKGNNVKKVSGAICIVHVIKLAGQTNSWKAASPDANIWRWKHHEPELNISA
jgi:hypothetical protein